MAFLPCSLSSRSIARAVYFLPSAQSVPTVSSLLPGRFLPFPTGMFFGGTRTSISETPYFSAALASSSMSFSLVWTPATMSKPKDIASIKISFQAFGIAPPITAVPISRLLAPALAADSRLCSGSPRSTVPPSSRVCPMQLSGRQ